MDSTQAFHAIINLFLIPLWLLSGALFPVSAASLWIRVLMYINPLTYGTELLRALLFPATASLVFPISRSLLILTGFAVGMFVVSFAIANRRTTKPAA
jgi:ABC-2 type transport system permease protein